MATAEWMCSAYGKDTCSVNSDSIRANDTFYIGVKCFFECNYYLYPQLVTEYVLADAEELQIEFQAYDSRIFTFYVPDDVEDTEGEGDINSITITAAPFSPDK